MKQFINITAFQKSNFKKLRKCNNEDCNGVLSNQINFIYSPIWVFIEFSIECTYDTVPLNITLNNHHFILNCCITKKIENFTTVYYINKNFYVYDILKPNNLKRLIKSHELMIDCAIYQIST